MDSRNGLLNKEQLIEIINKDERTTTESRRSANYKPSIWNHDFLQSFTSEYNEEKYKGQAHKLKGEVLKSIFVENLEPLAMLELIDSIRKLGLASLFEEETKEALNLILTSSNNHPSIKDDLYTTSLFFRILRQHGYYVSPDMFKGFTSEIFKIEKSTQLNLKVRIELFEACNQANEGENILTDAKGSCCWNLKNMDGIIDDELLKEVANGLELPIHWRVEWYNVRRQIHEYEELNQTNSPLTKLAKLNFNMVQATHQIELKEISRWWTNISKKGDFSFARDRIVESYTWAVGVAFEPQYENFRKRFTKIIKLIILIDDIYDIYGSLQELELFTRAVHRWDNGGTQNLPPCMNICLETLYDTTSAIASEIEEEKGWSPMLPHLQKVWTDFCKALLKEAKWYKEGYTPSLQEYLNNGWISCSGPILSLYAFFSLTNMVPKELTKILQNKQDLVYYSSLIIRLCNDQGTTMAEQERGDAPSSIICFMREENVSEVVARKYIGGLILDAWKKLNKECTIQSPLLQPFVKCIMNITRVVHFIYHNGDGFGVQNNETRDHVVSLFVEPLCIK